MTRIIRRKLRHQHRFQPMNAGGQIIGWCFCGKVAR